MADGLRGKAYTRTEKQLGGLPFVERVKPGEIMQKMSHGAIWEHSEGG